MKDNEKLYRIISEVFSLPVDQITDDLAYNSFTSWDSLKHLQMVSMIEEEFDIELEMEDIIDMSTIAKVKEITGRYLENPS